MALRDTFNQIIQTLTQEGYSVVTQPQELIRPNEIYVDIEDINLKEIFTGGNTIEVVVSITLIREDRLQMLDEVENIIKLLDLPTLRYERCRCEHDGEAIIVTFIFTYTEVIYSDK